MNNAHLHPFLLEVAQRAQHFNKEEMENIEKVLYTLLLSSLWYSFFKLIDSFVRIQSMHPNKLLDVKNRTVSGCHGFLSTIMCLQALVLKTPQQLNIENNYTANVILLFSFSFMVYHTILSALNPVLHYHLLFPHHIGAALYIGLYLFGEHNSFYGIVGILVGQVSNFSLNIKFIILDFNKKYTKAFQLAESIFFFLFLTARLCVFPLVVWIPVFDCKTSILIKFLLLLFALFSINMARGIFQVIKKNSQRKKQMEEKNIKYQWLSQDTCLLQKLSFFKQT